MYWQQLHLINFKNYRESSFDFHPKINCITGNNGVGKTNLLDAIYYLSNCKSYFNAIDSQNICFEQDFFVIQGKIQKEGEDAIYCGVKKGQKKKFKRNDAAYDKLADHIGQYPVVMISPYDQNILLEGSEIRRKFIDNILSQSDKRYLNTLIKYNKVLQQRNELLKQFHDHRFYDTDSIGIWNEQLANLALVVFEKRTTFIKIFEQLFSAIYSDISEGKEKVQIRYQSELEKELMQDILKKNENKDLHTQRTNGGTHKDDLLFTIKGYPLKKFGSQGQQKTYLIALKLAKFLYIKQSLELTPVLLLDDIFDKIDEGRVEMLMKEVMKHDYGQVFITDTHQNRVPSILDKIGKAYKTLEMV